ncbi:hypothetical protein WBJ53_10995 [Spirosoma sp. SC4-14]|uniref:hypothetical protein n=1 Tax=Spirosoma sp. SC4-14 TaxID=3128900 RepID=UPI0030D5421A
MILLAILVPGLSFLLRGKIISGIIAVILQIVAFLTFVFFGLGFFIWLGTAVWAVISYNNGKAEKRNNELIEAIKNQQQSQ